MMAIYVNWGTSRVRLTWTPTLSPPQTELITSIHAICFQNDKLLLVDIKNRGWSFPGGHIELNESPLDCVKREVLEEACVEGDCSYLGYVQVDHSENPSWNSDSPYPLIGYQAFYCMDITQVLPFNAIFESSQRMFIPSSEVTQHVENWHDVHADILKCALVHVS